MEGFHRRELCKFQWISGADKNMDLLFKSLTGRVVDKVPVLPVDLTGTAKLIPRAGFRVGERDW